jgi:hypothetical protein
LLNLTKEEKEDIYNLKYVTFFVAKDKSKYVLLKKADYEKKNKCMDLLKPRYIDHVVNKIT